MDRKLNGDDTKVLPWPFSSAGGIERPEVFTAAKGNKIFRAISCVSWLEITNVSGIISAPIIRV
jgi:hypothetical protein